VINAGWYYTTGPQESVVFFQQSNSLFRAIKTPPVRVTDGVFPLP
jgi:hypothetical protein